MAKRSNRSERAQREAILALKNGKAFTYVSRVKTFEVEVYFAEAPFNSEPIAIFDLRDIVRKREPLKGIKKTLAKAIQPKRKKR